MKFKLKPNERETLLNCFEKLYGKSSVDYQVVRSMDDTQLCKYWSKLFD